MSEEAGDHQGGSVDIWSTKLGKSILRLLPDEYSSDTDIVAAVRSLPGAAKESLIREAVDILCEPDKVEEEGLWLPIEILVALYPMSLPHIVFFLCRRQGPKIWYIHWRFFCYFEDWKAYGYPQTFLHDIEALLESYLMSVRTDIEYNLSRAATCLGESWNWSRAFRVLERVCRLGRSRQGRYHAAYGLVALAKRTKSLSRLDQLYRLGREILRKDPCPLVRIAADALCAQAQEVRASLQRRQSKPSSHKRHRPDKRGR